MKITDMCHFLKISRQMCDAALFLQFFFELFFYYFHVSCFFSLSIWFVGPIFVWLQLKSRNFFLVLNSFNRNSSKKYTFWHIFNMGSSSSSRATIWKRNWVLAVSKCIYEISLQRKKKKILNRKKGAKKVVQKGRQTFI